MLIKLDCSKKFFCFVFNHFVIHLLCNSLVILFLCCTAGMYRRKSIYFPRRFVTMGRKSLSLFLLYELLIQSVFSFAFTNVCSKLSGFLLKTDTGFSLHK
jgi:hypothetical protein